MEIFIGWESCGNLPFLGKSQRNLKFLRKRQKSFKLLKKFLRKFLTIKLKIWNYSDCRNPTLLFMHTVKCILTPNAIPFVYRLSILSCNLEIFNTSFALTKFLVVWKYVMAFCEWWDKEFYPQWTRWMEPGDRLYLQKKLQCKKHSH